MLEFVRGFTRCAPNFNFGSRTCIRAVVRELRLCQGANNVMMREYFVLVRYIQIPQVVQCI